MKWIADHPILFSTIAAILCFLTGAGLSFLIPSVPSVRDNQNLILQKLDAIEKRLDAMEKRLPR